MPVLCSHVSCPGTSSTGPGTRGVKDSLYIKLYLGTFRTLYTKLYINNRNGQIIDFSVD